MQRLLCAALFVGGFAAGTVLPALGQSTTTAPATRPKHIGVTTTQAYVPLPETDADGKVTKPDPIHVEPISDELRAQFRINPFYKKTLTIRGMPVIGSEEVSDYAFLECAYTIDHMLKDSPAWVPAALVRGRVKVGIIASVEYTMDIPENQNPQNMTPAAGAYQDRRSRGLGGRTLATCAEENLLNLQTDPYRSENITLHEFSHTIASNASQSNRDWGQRWQAAYRNATDKHLYDNTYAGTDAQEYWAEGAQSWFDCARINDKSVHSGIWTRQQMKDYDPAGAAILSEVYGDGEWRYVKSNPGATVVVGDVTYRRPPEDLAHLAGLDRTQIPAFSFTNSPRVQADPGRGLNNGRQGGGRRGGRGAATQAATSPATMAARADATGPAGGN